MATTATTATTQRVATSLKAMSLMLDDLPEVAQEWAGMREAEQASWSLDWDQAVGTHLQVLEQHYQAGMMTAHERVKYQELHKKLAEALPLAHQLGLFVPPLHQSC